MITVTTISTLAFIYALYKLYTHSVVIKPGLKWYKRVCNMFEYENLSILPLVLLINFAFFITAFIAVLVVVCLTFLP